MTSLWNCPAATDRGLKEDEEEGEEEGLIIF
jgi:hypothetical protein